MIVALVRKLERARERDHQWRMSRERLRQQRRGLDRGARAAGEVSPD